MANGTLKITGEKAQQITPSVLELLRAAGLTDITTTIEKVKAENKPRLLQYLDMFITVHPLMLKMKEQIKMVAAEDDPVLLQGETGTGKEILANALHSARKGRFIPLNCAGLPEQLIESELFGHVRGSFTGATSDRAGMMEAANNGTIFLDEIGELPLALQAKLLRAIQEKRIRRVGSNEENDISCRLVTATHHNLKQLVEQEKFREDLYWRISTLEFHTLPLRLRPSDIPLLVAHFDAENEIEDHKEFCGRINPEEDLPGNVRTIQKMVRRYILLREMPGSAGWKEVKY